MDYFSKYLNDTYYEILVSNYDSDYLNDIDFDNFNMVYVLLKEYRFNYLEDIIVNYLDLFLINVDSVKLALIDIKNILGNDYVSIIGRDMTLLDKLIQIADCYDEIN